MRTPLPPSREDEATRKERLQREHDGQRKLRLQMRYLLVTRQARERQEVARLLGGHRQTIGRWLARDAAGGLDALLAPSIPPGKPVSLAPAVLASLEQALRRPEGFASYEALRPWVRQTPGLEVTDTTLSTLVRVHFTAKLTVARPDHTKKPRGASHGPDDGWGTSAGSHPARDYPSGTRVQPR